MSRRLIAVVVLATLAVAAPALAGSTPTKSVKVGDDYFSPTRLTVDRGTKVAFRWQAANNNLHDAVVTSAPGGVRKWKSAQRRTDYTYTRTLRTAGTYRIICTIHPTQMRLTVRVRSGS
jgi:plastocyanin